MFKRENNAGLYLTIAVHLAVLIIFLLTKIGFTLREEVSFVLDFTKQEETEQLAKEAQLKEEVSKELDDIIAGRKTPVRNAVVDASQKGSGATEVSAPVICLGRTGVYLFEIV